MCTTSNMPILQFFNDIVVIAALISGLAYAFYGYKKNVANYYKAFMYLAFVAFTFSAISHLLYFNNAKLNTCAAIARVIPIALLTFKMDFGRSNSVTCACLVFDFSLLILIGSLIIFGSKPANIILSLNQVLLSAIVMIFVAEKYVDKESRGTK